MSRNSISLLYSFVVTVLLCYGPHLCSCFQQIVRSNKHPFFHHDRSTQNNNNRIIKTTKSCSELYFFNFGKKDNDKNEETTGEDKITTQERKEEISFFDRITRRITKNDDEDDIIKSSVEVGNAVVGTPAGIPTSKSISELSVITQPVLELTPMELATKLRADAQKARLEAEKMDAELTLKKIGRLEKELEYARTHPEKTNTELSQQMQREMDSLQAKFRGETIPPVTTNAAALVSGTTSVSKTITADAAPNGNQNLERYSNETLFQGKLSSIIKPIDSKILEANVREFEKVPSFFKKTTAMALGITFDTVDDINVTDIVVRQDMINRLDFSFTNLSPPKFTLKQIQEMETELLEKEAENNVWWKRFSAQELPEQIVEQRTSGIAKDNITEFALLVLEFEYYLEYISNIIPDALDKELEKDELGKLLQGEEWFEPLQKRLNSTFADSLVESFYPKCTRKEDKEPTSHQVQLLISDILPKATFQVTSKMEKISGGYIIRGKTKLNGDELIEKIETLIDKSPSLSDKMTVLYTSDFTDFENIQQVDPIIYVVGSDIVRESKPIQLSIVSAIGIATSWYLSLYPFLLNPNIASRVDEQIAIADASMTPDLGFLTDLSLPLFATFLSIQLAHEIAHIVVGSLNNIKTSPPTFVPSLFTGITSSVTTFRNAPKNKAAMFDFSIAGPIAGISASILAIVIGSQLTLGSDPSLFPALPLEILRQSTLGGSIINEILGNGALSVPAGALGSPAVAAMTVSLHPVAIAGYISLIVNSLSLLPVGTTDGGRVALTLFGREGKIGIGTVALFVLLFMGALGSDLFLFYFAFVIAFQTGNEIPSRNEVDQLDIPRSILAAVTYVVAFLCLVPFQ